MGKRWDDALAGNRKEDRGIKGVGAEEICGKENRTSQLTQILGRSSDVMSRLRTAFGAISMVSQRQPAHRQLMLTVFILRCQCVHSRLNAWSGLPYAQLCIGWTPSEEAEEKMTQTQTISAVFLEFAVSINRSALSLSR